jgi:outer membrane protein assembly factor BamB
MNPLPNRRNKQRANVAWHTLRARATAGHPFGLCHLGTSPLQAFLFMRPKRVRKAPHAAWIGACALFLLLAGCAAAPTSPSITAATSLPVPSSAPLPTGLPPPSSPPSPTLLSRTPARSTAIATVSTLNPTDWTTYHRDNARTGYVPNMPDPQQLTVAWNVALDGAVYAEPLVVGGHILVATESNSVYSLDARTGQVEWHTNIGEPVPRSALPCGNIDPLGITGTPVYDSATGLVFAVAEVSGPAHVLVGLDAHTGEVRVRRSADPEGMEPVAHQQRAALALSQGLVYIAYGGLFGDCGNYHGWVVASRTDGSGLLLAYQVPTNREGGIWAAAGPAVDGAGRLYVSVGNGSEVIGDWDHSDSVLRLSPTLKLEDGFAPDQWKQDNLVDADLGSLGPVLLPDNLVFIAGKAGVGYLLHSNALGGVGGQMLAIPVCHAYGGAAVVGSTLFVPCNEGVQQIQVGPVGNLTLGWQAGRVPGSPVVGGHTVYSLDRGGTLYALDIETGKVRATVNVGATSRFATPTLYGDRVFIGTLAGIVAVAAS